MFSKLEEMMQYFNAHLSELSYKDLKEFREHIDGAIKKMDDKIIGYGEA